MTKSEIATTLGVSEQTLDAIVSAGAARVGIGKAAAALDAARQKSAAIIAQAREQLQPQIDAIASREAQHQQIIANIESIKGEFEAFARSDDVNYQPILDQIV